MSEVVPFVYTVLNKELIERNTRNCHNAWGLCFHKVVN